MADAPLRGLRIVAVEQFGAGPFGSLHLADLGADVIRLEDPATGGDVVHGLGLTYAVLGPINPAIVCVSLSAYGRDGARAAEPGYDPLIQAEAGWAALTGEPDGPPQKSGLSLADYAAGLMAAFALMAAVFDARRTGRGRDVDVNLYDVALAMHSYRATWYLSAGVPGERTAASAHPSIVPFQFFATADSYLAIACAKEKFFRALVELLEMPELAADERFASFEARRRHREALLTILQARFREQPTDHWVRLLRGRVPVAPVRSMEAALDRDALEARGMLAAYVHPALGTVSSVGLPVRMSGFTPTYRPGPPLDGDRAEVLAQAGYGSAEIARLRDRGAFGQVPDAPP